MSSNVEFFVEAITKDHTGKQVHVGFVVTGGPIRVGDLFVSMYDVQERWKTFNWDAPAPNQRTSALFAFRWMQ